MNWGRGFEEMSEDDMSGGPDLALYGLEEEGEGRIYEWSQQWVRSEVV